MPVQSTKTAVGLVQLDLLEHAAGDLHQVGDAELHRRDRAGVEAAAEADDGLVAALAGDVDAHDQRRVRIARPARGATPASTRSPIDELQVAGAREDAAHAHPDEVGVLAVVLHPARDLRLVGHRHRARDRSGPAASDGRSGRRRSIRGSGRCCASGCRTRTRAARCLASVSAPSMVSQTGSGMAEASSSSAKARRPLLCRPAMASVLFSDQVMASTRQVLSWPGRVECERGRRVGEPVAVEAEAVPLGELGPGLGAELALGVGGDDAARVAHGRQRPQDDPRDQRRLADAVARGDGRAHGLARCSCTPSPSRSRMSRCHGSGPCLVGERRAGDAPREGVHDVAQGIEAQGADLAVQAACRCQPRRTFRRPLAGGLERPPASRRGVMLVLDPVAPLVAAGGCAARTCRRRCRADSARCRPPRAPPWWLKMRTASWL